MKMRRISVLAAALAAAALALPGCAGPVQSVIGFGGISTNELAESRRSALAKTFDYDYKKCYKMVEEILSGMPKTVIYSKSDNMIAVYYKDPNSTPVGVYIVPAGPNRTQVQVSSPAVNAKEWVARNLFNEKILKAQDEGFGDKPKDTL
jgi:hypothetical protein